MTNTTAGAQTLTEASGISGTKDKEIAMRSRSFGIGLTIMLLAAPCDAVSADTTQEQVDSTHARAGADETLTWNEVMLDAIVASTLGNPPTIRMAATVNSAMFDAQNGVGRRKYRPIFVIERAPHPAFNTVFPGPAEGGVKPRRYTRISHMAQEGIDARTYGGMHFRGSSNAAARVGAQIADYVLENAAQPIR